MMSSICPRCLQPETSSVPGLLPWPLLFWLLPPLSAPLLAPRVPLQQQAWLLEQRGRCLRNSGTQHWERESSLPCSPGPVGSHQVAEPSLARDWPGIDASHSAGSCSGAPNIVFENSDLGFQIRVFILFFSFIFKKYNATMKKMTKRMIKKVSFP